MNVTGIVSGMGGPSRNGVDIVEPAGDQLTVVISTFKLSSSREGQAN